MANFPPAYCIRRHADSPIVEEFEAITGFSETEVPTADELNAGSKIPGPIDLSSFVFSASRNESSAKHPFIAWKGLSFDANQVKENGLYNAWNKSSNSVGSEDVKVLSSFSPTTNESFEVEGLVPIAQTLWTPKFNGSQYVNNPAVNYNDNVRIEIKAFISEYGTSPNMVLLSATNDSQGRSYISKDVSWKFSLRSNYDFGNGVSLAQMPGVPSSGYVTIKAERVGGQISIEVNGLRGQAAINATATVEDGWERIGAHIDGFLNGFVGQIHEVKFTNLSFPAPVITRTLLATSGTKPNAEIVNGLAMVGFPDGDRWEMVRTK